MKKKWHIWLGITISVVLLYFFLRKIDFVKVGAILTHVDFSLVILAAAMQMAAQLLRAERWRVLVHPVKDIKLGRMFAITMIGMMSNNLFPARLGELIKAYLLGHQEGISKSTSLATVVVERLFDGLTIAVFMIAIILFFPFPRVDSSSSLNPRSLWTICLLSSFFYVGVLLLLLFIKKRQDLLKRFFQVTIEKILPKKAETFYNKLEDVIASFSEGLHFLHNKGVLLKITIQSIIMWLVIGLSFYLGFLAFGMKLSFFTAVLLMVVVAVAVMIPSSPGFVGTFHYSCQLVLVMMGVGVNMAASFAIVFHLVGFLPVTVVGLFYVFKGQMSLTQLQHVEE